MVKPSPRPGAGLEDPQRDGVDELLLEPPDSRFGAGCGGNLGEMRAMFALYSFLLVGGIVLFSLVGLTSG